MFTQSLPMKPLVPAGTERVLGACPVITISVPLGTRQTLRKAAGLIP